MELDRLEYFMAVVEEGSISAAARKMHLSQPPVSLQIQNLEAEYDTKLLERSGHGIQLTEAGNIIYAYALRIRELEGEAAEDIKDLKEGHRGRIRIGIISSGTCREFLHHLTLFHSNYPLVHFSVFDGNTYQMIDDLDKQHIDLAVIRTPFSSKGLSLIPLHEDVFAAAGTEKMMAGLNHEKVSLKELEDRPLIIYRRWEKILRKAFAANRIEPDIIALNDDARTSVQWAEAGMGIALVPSSILTDAHPLVSSIIDENALLSTICLVRKEGRKLSSSAEMFWNAFAK